MERRTVFFYDRLRTCREEIEGMLRLLPHEMRQGHGPGLPIAMACFDASGAQWGEEADAEDLLCLANALGMAQEHRVGTGERVTEIPAPTTESEG